MKIISKLKTNNFLKYIEFCFVETLYLVFIDFFNQYLIIKSFSLSAYYIKEAVAFNIIWICFYYIILYLLNPKLRKLILLILNVFFLSFSIINYFVYSYFNTIFSWKDLLLSGNGLSFINSILKFINFKIILFILISIFFIIVIIKIKTIKMYKFKSIKTPIIILLLIILFTGYTFLKNKLSNTYYGWDSISAKNNDSNYYTNWINPPKLIRLSGTYEYIIRDFYFSILKKENVVVSSNYVKKYIKNNSEKTSDQKKYRGIFKEKNLIFVMMESMDDWMINQKVTPTIYEMMKHGFNFVNHYSPAYVTGETANTEFIANTGIYPIINKLSPIYAYVNNSYPYSLANLFKSSGYTSNSFHRSDGSIYNRNNMHLSLGYETYNNYQKMGISDSNLDLDSHIIIDGYNKIVNKKDKFLSFIITYSPHSPYTYEKIECQKNLNAIKKLYLTETNEEKICAYSAARETDNMFELLINNLKKDNMLEDTIIIAFSDHPNKVILQDNETDKLNKTTFFIYSSQMGENEINNVTSTVNILPLVINLFELNNNYTYPGYDPLNSNDSYVIFSDYTYYDGYKIKPITKKMNSEINYSSNLLISDYYKK